MPSRPMPEANMRVRDGVLLLALLAGFSPAASAISFEEATAELDGAWRGDDFFLRVDAERAQASLDPERPFQWQRFLVKEVARSEERRVGKECRCRREGEY